MEGNVRKAANLFDTADGKSGDMASVAWIGYDAPSGSLGGITEVGSTSQAERGGDLLAADINGFVAARDQLGLGQGTGDADKLNLSVIGHSYGSTTVSYAGADAGLAGDVDTITLVGSPGAGPVHNAEEFGIGRDDVYVGANSGDVVSAIGSTVLVGGPLGHDPAFDDFGAIRFQAEGGDTTFGVGSTTVTTSRAPSRWKRSG